MQLIGPRDVEELARQGAVLLDVRPRDDFRRAHIPGARSAPIDAMEFANGVRHVAPFFDQPVVVYCRDADCLEAARACEQLHALGYSSIYCLDGGSVAWWHSGRPLEGGQVEAHLEPDREASARPRDE